MEPFKNLYIRFMVWLGAAPPPGYEYLLQNEKSKPSPKSYPTSARSPLSLDILEISLAVIGGALALGLLHYNIWNAQPWDWGDYNEPNEPYPEWFISQREDILILTWPLVIAVAMSTIFLVRSIRGNVRHFSDFGHFVLAWPLIDFLPLATVGMLGCQCLPIQFVLAISVSVITLKDRQNFGDLITIPVSIGWTALGYLYAIEWWSLIGD